MTLHVPAVVAIVGVVVFSVFAAFRGVLEHWDSRDQRARAVELRDLVYDDESAEGDDE